MCVHLCAHLQTGMRCTDPLCILHVCVHTWTSSQSLKGKHGHLHFSQKSKATCLSPRGKPRRTLSFSLSGSPKKLQASGSLISTPGLESRDLEKSSLVFAPQAEQIRSHLSAASRLHNPLGINPRSLPATGPSSLRPSHL